MLQGHVWGILFVADAACGRCVAATCVVVHQSSLISGPCCALTIWSSKGGERRRERERRERGRERGERAKHRRSNAVASTSTWEDGRCCVKVKKGNLEMCLSSCVSDKDSSNTARTAANKLIRLSLSLLSLSFSLSLSLLGE